MNEPHHYQQIVEGTTSVYIPHQHTKERGPGKKQGPPFYNPAMELNRDVSIAVAQWMLSNTSKKHMSLLDGLAATGIRGIRFIHELAGSFDVTINDWSDEAFEVIKKNTQKTSSERIIPSKKDLNMLLLEQKFDYIDVDPFGSPVSFIDASMKSIHHNGILAVTATDTAALCGVYPRVCQRRYAANPYHGSIMHEVGLRILLGFVAREATKHEVGIRPILSYKTDHYMRLYIQIKRNVSSANDSAHQIQPIPASELFPFNKNNTKLIGPLWIGKLHTKPVVIQLRKKIKERQFNSKKKMMKLFSILEEEAIAPLFYYTTDDLGSLIKCSPPKLEQLWKTFHQENIPIFRTQFNPTGFKTSASFSQVKQLFIKACQTSE